MSECPAGTFQNNTGQSTCRDAAPARKSLVRLDACRRRCNDPSRGRGAPSAVFSRVSTPEAQPHKGNRTAAGFSRPNRGRKKRGTPPELKHPPRAAYGTCVAPNPPAAVAGPPLSP